MRSQGILLLIAILFVGCTETLKSSDVLNALREYELSSATPREFGPGPKRLFIKRNAPDFKVTAGQPGYSCTGRMGMHLLMSGDGWWKDRDAVLSALEQNILTPESLLHDESPVVRYVAYSVIRNAFTFRLENAPQGDRLDDVVDALAVNVLRPDPHEAGIALDLIREAGKFSVEAFTNAMENPHPYVRFAALRNLDLYDDSEDRSKVLPMIVKRLTDTNSIVRYRAYISLESILRDWEKQAVIGNKMSPVILRLIAEQPDPDWYDTLGKPLSKTLLETGNQYNQWLDASGIK